MKRAFVRKYPHRILYRDFDKNFLEALYWCQDNLNRNEWVTCDEINGLPTFILYNNKDRRVPVVRFANHRDAVHFTLMWVE